MIKLFLKTALLTSFANVAWAANSYPISSCEDLANIADAQGEYYLLNSFDCGHMEIFEPIAFEAAGFSGTLNGNSHTISNLTIQQGEKGTGLFEQIIGADEEYAPAIIQNINFDTVEISGTSSLNSNTGLIAGSATEAIIKNINVKNLTIHGTDQAKGGILGTASNLTLSNADLHTKIDIAHNQFAGGLIGNSLYDVKIVDSRVSSFSVNSNCQYDTCAVGGLVGIASSSEQIQLPTQISRSSASGNISTKKNGGGLIGFVNPIAYVNIDNSFAIVKITAEKYAGGLIGRASEDNDKRGNIMMTHVYAAGAVVGNNDQCDEVPPDGSGHCGKRGILGNEDKSTPRVKPIGSFYDKDTTTKENSGDRYSDHGDNKTYESKGKKTSDMKTAQTFKDADWDESIWKLVDGSYPTLHLHPEI